MAIINIGTNKKNITGIVVKKPFKDITFSDIQKIVKDELGDIKGISIQGWCDVTHTKNSKTNK